MMLLTIMSLFYKEDVPNINDVRMFYQYAFIEMEYGYAMSMILEISGAQPYIQLRHYSHVMEANSPAV